MLDLKPKRDINLSNEEIRLDTRKPPSVNPRGGCLWTGHGEGITKLCREYDDDNNNNNNNDNKDVSFLSIVSSMKRCDSCKNAEKEWSAIWQRSFFQEAQHGWIYQFELNTRCREWTYIGRLLFWLSLSLSQLTERNLKLNAKVPT